MSTPKKDWSIDGTQQMHEKNEIPQVAFIGGLYKSHVVLSLKIADLQG